MIGAEVLGEFENAISVNMVRRVVSTTLNIKTYCFSISNDSEGKLKSLKSEA